MRVLTKSQRDSKAARAGTSGSCASCAWASPIQERTVSLASSTAGDLRSRPRASACSAGSVRSAVEQQLAQPDRVRVGGGAAQRVEDRQRPHALAQVGALLPCPTRRRWTRCRARRRRAARPPRSACTRRRSGPTSRRTARRTCAPNRPDVAISDPVFSVDDVHVVIERVLTRPHPDRLGSWPSTSRPNVSAWILIASGPEVGEDAGRAGEQVVAGQDRDRVAEARVGRLVAAADDGLVHDVVVEQGRQVGQLDGDRGGHDAACRGSRRTGRRAARAWRGSACRRPASCAGRPRRTSRPRRRRCPAGRPRRTARSSAISAVRAASARSTGTAMVTTTPCRRRTLPMRTNTPAYAVISPEGDQRTRRDSLVTPMAACPPMTLQAESGRRPPGTGKSR